MKKRITRKAFALFLSGTACSVAQSGAAYAENRSAETAQTIGNGRPAAPDEIIVTATRRSESLQDVPMSVDVATGEQIQRLNIFDAKDVQQLSPGLALENTDGRSNFATLRGISFDPDQGTDPSVDTYFNEVPSDAQNTFTAIYDIDQIEVLRGPQGALRGRTSPAGAITIRTRRANLNDFEGFVQGTVTEDHAHNLQGAISLPILKDVFALRVSGLTDRNRLNQVRNVNRGDSYPRGKTDSFRLSLAARPAESLNINLMYQYLNSDNRVNQQVFGPGNTPISGSPVRNGPPADADDYIAVQEGVSRFRNYDHRVTLNADWDMGPVTLSVVGGYQHATLDQILELDYGNAVPGYVSPDARPENGVGRTTYPTKMAEARLSSNNDGGFLNWGISAYYYKQGGSYKIRNLSEDFADTNDNIPDDVGFPINIYLPIKTRTMAFSGNVRLQFTEKLKLDLAARYTDIKKRQQTFIIIPGFGSLQFQDDKIRKHPLTGAANLTYEFSPDVTAYASYGRSFRAPTCDVGTAISTASGENFTDDLRCTKPEKSDSVELGVKTSLLDRRLSFNAAIFYQKFKDYISREREITYDPRNGDPLLVSEFNYNGDATVKGVEGTLAGKPVENWDFSLSASYVRGRYDNAPLPCNVGLILPGNNVAYCTSNGRIGEIPDFSLTANSEFRFSNGPIQPFVRGLLNFRPGYQSERQNYHFKSRSLLNVYVGVRGDEGKWELNAFAKNVLNQHRITSISPRNLVINTLDGDTFDSGYRRINATNPREFGVTGLFRF